MAEPADSAHDVGAEADDNYLAAPGGKPKNWARRGNSKQVRAAERAWTQIQDAYSNLEEYASRVGDYWNIYNCELDENQSYSGYSQVYIPIVRDCVAARRRRVLAQLFPAGDRHIEAISEDGHAPQATASLLEHYINTCDLKTKIGSMLTQGDVTGQWNLYVDWSKDRRRTIKLVQTNALIGEKAEVSNPAESYEDVEDEFVVEEHPDVWIPATTDIAVIPESVDSLEEAHVVCIRHRMSKNRIQDMLDRGLFVGATSEELVKNMEVKPKDSQKKLLEQLGIRTEGKSKIGWVFEAHMRMHLDHEEKEPAVVWYRADGKVLGIQVNPMWRKRIPLLCAPVEKVNGVFRGKSQVEPVRFLQWQANDMANIGQDAAMYSVLPVVLTDPEKNPNYQSMVLSMAAVWPVDPKSTDILKFPDIYQQAWGIVGTLKAQIRESMGVNEYQLGQMPQGRKQNAQVGALNQESGMSSTDEAKDVENRILNPMLELMFELDTQYRDVDQTVLVMGEVGARAHMEKVPPQQFSAKYLFRWLGTEFINSIQRIQQQIATMNVLRAIPPQALQGKQVDITPIIEAIVQTVFGSRLAPKIIIDQRDQLTMDPELENTMLANGMAVTVKPMDNDVLHLQSHNAVAISTTDPSGNIRSHMLDHLKHMQAKSAAASPMGGMPGVPGGSAPGVAGTPRIGAQPGNVRPLQRPPGAIHGDAMVSPEAMSRG